MNPVIPEQAEVLRIRSAYARRAQTIPENRYSIFNQAHHLWELELQEAIVRLLKRFHRTGLDKQRILDVGCGNGSWLRQFIQWGALPGNLCGIDLLPERIHEAESLCPAGVNLACGDASHLAFEDQTFDLVLLFTVFTSILKPAMKRALASEVHRVLKADGAILWYDFFVSNPQNPDVHGVNAKEITELFPGLAISLERITLAPPLGRAAGSFSPTFYRLLSAAKVLCTHYLGLLRKL